MTGSRILIEQMISIYNTVEVDWMGFPITNGNILTYHHITRRRNGGPLTKENGALVTKKGHKLLNLLEVYKPELYEEWNLLFGIINASNKPPTEEMQEWIASLKKRTLDFRYGAYREMVRLKKVNNGTYSI